MAKSKTRAVSAELAALTLTRLTRTIYFVLVLYVIVMVLFDSGNLIQREAIIDRITLVFIVMVINTIAWYAASERALPLKNASVYILTILLIAFAGFNTYWERGMASTSTILYALPLLTAALVKNRHALIATAALCASTYSFASIKYFNDFFNEGYRIQLWGTLLLQCGIFFGVTWLIMIIAGLRHDSK